GFRRSTSSSAFFFFLAAESGTATARGRCQITGLGGGVTSGPVADAALAALAGGVSGIGVGGTGGGSALGAGAASTGGAVPAAGVRRSGLVWRANTKLPAPTSSSNSVTSANRRAGLRPLGAVFCVGAPCVASRPGRLIAAADTLVEGEWLGLSAPI